MKKSLLFIIALVVSGFAAQAQTIPVSGKFGSISKEELEMTTYAPDTSAAAVILYTKRTVSIAFDTGSTIKRKDTRLVRYKVLKDSGKECGDFHLLCYSDHGVEYISDIKGASYNLESGKTVVSKLNKKQIFTEKETDKLDKTSFSVPDVKVGSVVEVQITFISTRYWDIGTLWTQFDYPVNSGELIVDYTSFFRFNRMVLGYRPFDDMDKKIINKSVAVGGGESAAVETIVEKYVTRDVPALKQEKYCFYPNQTRMGVDYDLREVSVPGSYYKDYSSTWGKIDQQLIEGGLLNECRKSLKFTDDVKVAIAGESDECKTLETVRKMVLERVRWNKKNNRFPNTDKAVREGEGDAADICGVMASVLNAIGYTAVPVLIKTRDMGVLADFHVTSDAYNAMILQITTPSGAVWYTDVARPYTYLNVLPASFRVNKARAISFDKTGSWVDLSNLGRNFHNQQTIAKVSADGVISGKISINGSDGVAMDMKNTYLDETDKEKYLDAIEKELGVEVSDYSFKGDKDWSAKASLTLDFTADAVVAGDYIYLKPFFNQLNSDTAFKEPERKSPIDFDYPEDIKLTCSFTIPEGYVIEELPTNTQYTLDIAGSKMLVKYVPFNSNTVMISYIYSRKAMLVRETQYEPLRKYWEQLSNVGNATIVLKKQ